MAKNNPCQCGCGEMVVKNFKQGHDARHKSNLINAVLGFHDDSEEAYTELDNRGWLKFLEKARNARSSHYNEIRREQAKENAVQGLLLVERMKQAANRLKGVNRYKRGPEQILVTPDNVDEILSCSDEELLSLPSTLAAIK